MIRTLPHILAVLLICLLGSGGLLWLHHQAVDMQAMAMAADGVHDHHGCHHHHHHHAPASPDGSDEDAPGPAEHPDCPECVMLGAAKSATLSAPAAIIGDGLPEEKLVVSSARVRGIHFRELPPARGPPAA